MGRLLTVFSSSRYCGGTNEAACVLADSRKLRMIRLDTSWSDVMHGWPLSEPDCTHPTHIHDTPTHTHMVYVLVLESADALWQGTHNSILNKVYDRMAAIYFGSAWSSDVTVIMARTTRSQLKSDQNIVTPNKVPHVHMLKNNKTLVCLTVLSYSGRWRSSLPRIYPLWRAPLQTWQ